LVVIVFQFVMGWNVQPLEKDHDFFPCHPNRSSFSVSKGEEAIFWRTKAFQFQGVHWYVDFFPDTIWLVPSLLFLWLSPWYLYNIYLLGQGSVHFYGGILTVTAAWWEYKSLLDNIKLLNVDTATMLLYWYSHILKVVLHDLLQCCFNHRSFV